MTTTYKAVFERDESGAWIVRIPAIRGCHTYGLTLNQARRRIRETLSLWVDDADDALIEEEIRLPAAARAAGGHPARRRQPSARGVGGGGRAGCACGFRLRRGRRAALNRGVRARLRAALLITLDLET